MCDALVNTCVFVFRSVSDLNKTQEMCDRIVSEDSFMIIYYPYTCKTQNMCDKAVGDCLAALTFILDLFVASKMLEKFHDALLTNNDILSFDEDFSKVTFFANEIDTYF